MNYMTFENDYGKITMGLSSGYDFVVKKISGLELPSKNYEVVQYLDIDGQSTKKNRVLARTITIVIDICNYPQRLSRNLYNIMSHDTGILRLYFGNTRRKIKVNQIKCSDFDNYNIIRSLTVQMTCDIPFFTDFDPVIENCFSIKDNLTGDQNVTTPSKWTLLVDQSVIKNKGYKKSYPVFTIIGTASGTPSGTGIEIQKLDSSGNILQKIVLEHLLSNGEVITINLDIGNDKGRRFIHSSIHGDITYKRSDDTNLNDFWLDVGDNVIKVYNYMTNIAITCIAQYDNLYIEGVY